MDINDLRGLATILCMVAFLSVVIWAYSPSRKNRFEEAARLPFEDEERNHE
ncbi:MAG: cbb3-type cytochrome c oxidase subunit 3 [Pseudomonadales bacterium]|nr:cbb3-type cytochrome c oxidase subunit 3 [Pseudomonadales bacterium]